MQKRRSVSCWGLYECMNNSLYLGFLLHGETPGWRRCMAPHNGMNKQIKRPHRTASSLVLDSIFICQYFVPRFAAMHRGKKNKSKFDSNKHTLAAVDSGSVEWEYYNIVFWNITSSHVSRQSSSFYRCTSLLIIPRQPLCVAPLTMTFCSFAHN